MWKITHFIIARYESGLIKSSRQHRQKVSYYAHNWIAKIRGLQGGLLILKLERLLPFVMISTMMYVLACIFASYHSFLEITESKAGPACTNLLSEKTLIYCAQHCSSIACKHG